MGNLPDRYAVVMGDIVHSERETSTERLYACFNDAIMRQNGRHAAVLASPLTITLGDEFQGLLTSLVDAAVVARAIRFDLLRNGIDCRFVIGPVTLKSPLNTERAWNMMGDGLAAARTRLNEKRNDTYYRFLVPDNPVLETLLEASGATLTAIERSWTDTQRLSISAMLDGRTPAEIARQRDVSVHSVYKVRTSGNFNLYVTHLDAIRAALVQLDSDTSLSER